MLSFFMWMLVIILQVAGSFFFLVAGDAMKSRDKGVLKGAGILGSILTIAAYTMALNIG